MMQNHRTVESITGGEYLFHPPITYRNGNSVPEIKLKIWTDENGLAFVEALSPVADLAVSIMMPSGFRIPWFGKRDIRVILPWSKWPTDSPNRVTSYCRGFEVLQPGRKVELPMDEGRYPRISIDGTNFEIHWEVQVSDGIRVLFVYDSWEVPRTAVSTE